MEKETLNIAEEFSPVPIGRTMEDSDTSGEAFRERILFPKVSRAIAQGSALVIDFSGMKGLSSSFLEEAFGGLIREKELELDAVLKTLEFTPEDSPYGPYIENVKDYIKEAAPQ